MTGEEKQKAIDALKISAPVMVVTQEEFYDYIKTLNKIIDWLEQEPCEDTISRQDETSILIHIAEELEEWLENTSNKYEMDKNDLQEIIKSFL